MKKIIGLVFLSFAFCSASLLQADTFGSGLNVFDIEFVTIGDPGNPSDTPVPIMNGSVDYSYRIGKYEISRSMVTKANAEGNLAISMANLGVFGGNGPNQPASGISWNEAARFVNWLNTSQGFFPAYKFMTQPGDTGYGANQNISLWTLGDAGYNSANPFRNRRAKYFLPNHNQQYKAAYYDAMAGVYYDYPTGSNTLPTAVVSGTLTGTAVYGQPFPVGPAEVFQAGGLSPYGVMGLAGNVWEWNENFPGVTDGDPAAHRGIFGGSWDGPALGFVSNNTGVVSLPTAELLNVGFRVASIFVPEPSTALLSLFGALALLARNNRSSLA